MIVSLQYEDETLKVQALSVLPDDIFSAIGASGEAEEALARQLLAFFKNDFFAWVELLLPIDFNLQSDIICTLAPFNDTSILI